MEYKNTNQRTAIYNCIDRLGHATPEEIIEDLKSHGETASVATVYRTLKMLMDSSKVRKIHVYNKIVYETIKEEHYHFECLSCGKVIDYPITSFRVKNESNEIQEEIVGCNINLYGYCKDCKKKMEEKR